MPTPIEVERQIAFERKQVRGGVEKLRKDTKKLEDKTYASATVYGSVAIHSILLELISYIDKKKEKYKLLNGTDIALHSKYTFPIDTEVQALITSKVVFDHVFSPRKIKQNVMTIALGIGHAIEGEAQLTYYESTAPELFETLKRNYWHDAKGTAYKRKCMQTLMHKKGITPWTAWDKTLKTKIGLWLLECLCKSTGYFDKLNVRKGVKTYLTLVPTEKFIKYQEEIVKCAELYSPLTKPMLIPPRKWSVLQDGGYFLNDLTRCYEMVRRGYDGLIQGEIPIEFLNKIQEVGYRLNPFTMGVAEELERRGRAVGKFRPVIEHIIPPKPSDIDTNKESRTEWKRAAREARNLQANEVRKSCRTRMTMNIAREFRNDVWFLPFSYDYRGRAYPIPSFLTPQDTDFGKSLLISDKGAPITDEAKDWLSFQVSTCFGLDKASWQERIDWCLDFENFTRICMVATDPLKYIGEWENVDEPWQFLAACEEWYAIHTGKRVHTHLFVATDATCSGLQILAGMARDKSTAQMVNVIGSDKPQDAYKVIAEKSKPHIPERLRMSWDRKKCKRCVMTIPYNAKPFSNRAYIREALKDDDIKIDKDELTQCVKAVRSAMEDVVPGPMKVMRWIESEVSKSIKNGAKIIKWETPSGFIVVQKLMKHETKTIRTQLMGRTDIAIAGNEKGVDLKHHKNATAPNLIHSYDASLLHLSITEFGERPIATIHDSVLCLATDMKYLSTLVRKTYMHLFAENEPLRNFAREIKAETEPPIIGDLQPSEVIESTYFFC